MFSVNKQKKLKFASLLVGEGDPELMAERLNRILQGRLAAERQLASSLTLWFKDDPTLLHNVLTNGVSDEDRVDDFIDGGYGKNVYARFVLNMFRFPAALQIDFAEFINAYPLHARYDGSIWRVTGASRMGDVWLAEDLNQTEGYDLRVSPTDIEQWIDARPSAQGGAA